MSRAYAFRDLEAVYFVSFATVNWIDVFTRLEYKDIVVDSLQYCQQNKGLELYGWCIMTNHVHLLIRAGERYTLSAIMRDLKKFTSKQLLKAIAEHPQESRKEWMLWMFERAGHYNSNNEKYQFWQQNNHPIELSTPELFEQKLTYVHQNPVVTGIVQEPWEYLYSSARVFQGEKGLLEIRFVHE